MDEFERQIDSRAGFDDALHIAFESICRAGCRQVLLCDEDFVDWPLGTPQTVALLTAWAQPRRELHVIARSFDGVLRRHPRWVAWRRQWSHVVRCCSPDDMSVDGARGVALPTLLVAPRLLALRLVDRGRFGGRLTANPAEVESLRQQFDAISQQSVDSFSATTLGLREYPAAGYN